jgi:poly(3-hydroxyalkanoate) synthetase
MPVLHPWFGLLAASIAASRSAFDVMAGMVEAPLLADATSTDQPRAWTTGHIQLHELTTMRVLDFSHGSHGSAAIIVAPFALHATTTADFAPSHSVVEALLAAGVTRLVLTDWRSASKETRYLSIDSYLADLNVLVDDFGAPAALVGLCQGGWLAGAYAARFPEKVSRLALVGAPIDIEAGQSALAGIAAMTTPQSIAELLKLGHGLLLGKLMMAMWPAAAPTKRDIDDVLQLQKRANVAEAKVLHERFAAWNNDLIDLPGVFYQQTTDWIFRENRLAKGTFMALGTPVSLKAITCPLFLLAADDDEIINPSQLLSMADHVSTRRADIMTRNVPGRHLSLFMGQRILTHEWREIGRFLGKVAACGPVAA